MNTFRRRLAAILVFTMVFELLPAGALPTYAEPTELIADQTGGEDLELLEEPAESELVSEEAPENTLISEETPDTALISEEGPDTAAIPEEDSDNTVFTPDGISYLVPEQTYKNITWSIDSNGCLTVSGKNDFKASSGDYAPWHTYSAQIKSAEINLTNYTKWLSRMFEDCTNLGKVTFTKLETGSLVDISNMFKGCTSLKIIDATKISPKSNSRITNMSGLFDGCSSLTDVYLVEYKAGTNLVAGMFDTTAATDMSYMFRGCSSLTGLDISKLDTTKVTNMKGMFEGCSGLTYLDLSKFYVGNVLYATDMLKNTSLVSVNSPRFLTSNGNRNIEIDLPGSGWMRTDTKSPVTSLTYDIPAGTLVTTNNTSDEDLIYQQGNIKDKVFWIIYKDGTLVVTGSGEIRNTSTDLPPWLAYSSYIKKAEINLDSTYDLSYMFYGCSTLSMANLSRLDTKDATNMSYMFSGCRALTQIDLSGFDTGKVNRMRGMFQNCSSLTSLDLFHLDTSRVTNMSNMFEGCSALTDIDFTGKDTGKLKGKPRLFSTAEVRDMAEIFKNCSSLVTLDLSKFDLGKTNTNTGMLTGCEALETIYSPANKEKEISLPRCNTTPLGVWKNNTDNKRVNTIPVNTASGTCFTYETEEGTYGNVNWWIDINHVLHVEGTGNFRDSDGLVPWAVYTNDIHKARINLTESTDLSRMFESCDKLTEVTWVNNTMTAICTNMFAMFRGCKSLRTVDLSIFTTDKVENMSYMFEGCELMQSIAIGGFNTAKVIDVRGMFRNCKSLTELNLSNFDLSSVTEAYRFERILENCTELNTVYAPDKLGFSLPLPSIEGKGWRLETDANIPPERFYSIPARTAKNTKFVTALNITGISLYEADGSTPLNPSYDLDPGNTMQVVAKVTPSGADPLEIVWTTKFADIASVTVDASTVNRTAGTVKVTVTAGNTTGNSLITASFGDADSKVFTIRVSSALKLSPSALDITSGTTLTDAIRATISDTAYNVEDLVWTSQYPKVVKVTGTAAGATLEAKSGVTVNRKVEITASTPDGKFSDVCIVTVIPDPNPAPVWGDIDEQYIRDLFGDDPENVPTGIWYLMPKNIGVSDNQVEYVVYHDSDTLDYGRVYTGSNITFDEELRAYYGVRRLWRGRDFNILYRNNKFAAESDDDKAPFFIISGINSFQNSVTFKFNIFPEDINNAKLYSDAVVAVDLKTKLATIQPNIRYKGTKLTPGRDITLTYYKNDVRDENLIENPKNYQAAAGETYYIDIKGKDGSDFTGTWATPVKLVVIDPHDRSTVRMSKVRVKTRQLEWRSEGYTLAELFDNTLSDNEAFRVYLDNYDLAYGTDYTVDDTLLYDSGEYKIKLHGTGNTSGSGAAFVGEKEVKIEIKGTPASKVKFAAFTNTVYYTGDVITMEDLHIEDSSNYDKVTLYTVKDGREILLIEGTDYDYEMVNSAATGKFDLTVTLKGAYNGVITKSIRVLRYNIAEDAKKLIDVETENTTFSRAGAKPKVTVYFDGKELIENIDYKLAYRNNNKLGEETDGFRAPQVEVTGIGNFSGKITDKFSISKAKLQNLELILDDKEYKAKFARNYFKSSPRIMDDGVVVKIGKDKDIEPIDRNAYTYRYADGGPLIPDTTTSGIPDGALIEVSVQITAGEKSPYEAETRTITGYYRFISKYKSLKSAKISLLNPTELIVSDSEEEVMEMLDNNLTITIKNKSNEVVTLVKGRDYEITSLTGYMNPGTASITLKGLNNYSGIVTYNFKMYRRKN